jgi:general secretion pathway protein K
MNARPASRADPCPSTLVDAARPADRGFVLVSVLWLLALLTLVALALMTTARLDVRAAGQLVRHAEAEALADGLTRLVALRLGDRDRRLLAEAGITTDGAPLHCSHRNASVEIAVNDVGGLVDLNAASQPLLEWVLLRRGVAAGQARSIAAAIVDFRDADDLPSGPEGAESAAYQAAGLRHGPKNAPFQSVTELDQVLGMTPGLLNCLRAVVTVYGRQPGIDAAHAPRELIAAPSKGDTAVATSTDGRAPMPIPSEFRMSSKGLAYRVVVRASTDRRGRFAREAVIEPARTEPLGYRVREWTVAPSDVAPPADASSENRQSCLQVLL